MCNTNSGREAKIIASPFHITQSLCSSLDTSCSYSTVTVLLHSGKSLRMLLSRERRCKMTIEHQRNYITERKELPNRVIRGCISEMCRAEHMLYWNKKCRWIRGKWETQPILIAILNKTAYAPSDSSGLVYQSSALKKEMEEHYQMMIITIN